MAYTTDLTESQFKMLESLLSRSQTYQSVISRDHIVNAILYQLKIGSQWINRCRELWKNCEGPLRTGEAKIRICAIRLILQRIA